MKLLFSRQEAKLNMYEVVEMLGDENAALIAANPAFASGIAELKPVIADIKTLAQQTGENLTGIAADKKVNKTELCRIAGVMAGRIIAYANKTGDNTLKRAVDYSRSDLMKLKDAEVALQCQNIHDKASKFKTELADYGVTDAKLSELQTAINNYTPNVSLPRTAVIERSTIKVRVKEKFKQADQILTGQLDKLIDDFADTNPEFVTKYKKARIIVDPKTSSRGTGEGGTQGGGNPPA